MKLREYVYHRLRVFENIQLRRIFKLNRDKIVCGTSQLVLSAKYIRMIKSRMMRWSGHITHMGRIGRHKTGKPEGKRPLVRILEKLRLLKKDSAT
jgi:hypothetical protein